ncbi:VCBS repeat-containing protein [Streptomyces sp. NPDC097619]|uniref:VCBS repeat-containing protein n=1 Tax=Streptomyces sp. NPDC097619 TaxID=3157228 RepID=UPI0033305DD0
MSLARPTRRRLAGLVTTVLAVTLGATPLTSPAHAEPAAAAPSGTTAGSGGTALATAAPIPYPKKSTLAGVGLNGFLTTSASRISAFRDFAGGVGQGYDGTVYLRSTPTADYLVHKGTYTITQRNLKKNGVFQVAVGSLPGDARWAGAAGDALFTTLTTEAGTVLRKHVDGAAVVPVTGLPTDAGAVTVTPATTAHALVSFTQSSVSRWGLLDLAAGTFSPGTGALPHAVSETRTAWSDATPTSRAPRVFVADRATGTVHEAPVPTTPASGLLQVGLVGDWVVYGQKGAMSLAYAGPHHAITAHNVVTGATVKILDHAYELVSTPDGGLYARGGLLGSGEGLYRLTATGDTLGATLVAATGEPTEVTLTSTRVPPAELDLDRTTGFTFTWTPSRALNDPRLVLRHVRTGRTETLTAPVGSGDPMFSWEDVDRHEAVPNGEYTWELTAPPANGIGPTATARGTFKVVRTTQPHDFTDNGSPDLLTRDSAGRLWRTDLFYRPVDPGRGIDEVGPQALIGAGWGVYDRVEAAGHLGGTPVGDLLARDKSGVLWLYEGKGTGAFGTRVRIGGGWQVYDRITSGSDLTGDGRADALAVDKSGVLWLYTGTGTTTKPFLPRKKIGTSWGIYNDITAVGNIAGAAAGDLVARDKDGVLWLYLGKGDGTFAARTKVGGGWNAFRPLIAAGDVDGDGRPDLIAPGKSARSTKLYKSTGNAKAPFAPAESALLPLSDHTPTDLLR